MLTDLAWARCIVPVRESGHPLGSSGQAEPAESGPVAEPGGSVGGLLLDGSAAFAEAGFDGALQRFAMVEGGEDGELFPFETPEIDHVVDAMDGEMGGNRQEAGDGGNFFAFLTLGHGVAGHVGTGIVLDGEEQIVDRIAKIEQANVGLKLEAKPGRIGMSQDFEANRGQGGRVEGFDFGPFEADHVESELEARRACGTAKMPA